MMKFRGSRAIYIRPKKAGEYYGMGVSKFTGQVEIEITTEHWFVNSTICWILFTILVSYSLLMVPGMFIVEKYVEGTDTAQEDTERLAVNKSVSENDWVNRRRNLAAKEKYRR